MKRYTIPEVYAALEETDRNMFTPHAQIVLAGEVQALQLHFRSVKRCERHAILMYVSDDGELQCFHCGERARLEAQIVDLQRKLAAATECPMRDQPPAADGSMQCQYRSHKQAQVSALQATNENLREQVQQLERLQRTTESASQSIISELRASLKKREYELREVECHVCHCLTTGCDS